MSSEATRSFNAGQRTASQRRSLKQERAVRTYTEILHAAAEVFALKGFSNVTLLDIAEQAGVTKGAVYFHYANKEALAVAVLEEYYRRLPELAEGVRQLDLDPLDATSELLTRVAVALRDDKIYQAAVRLHIEHFLIDSNLPVPFVSFIELVEEFLTQAEARGQLPGDHRPAALARATVAAFFGAQHLSWVLSNRTDIVERVEEVIDLVVPGR